MRRFDRISSLAVARYLGGPPLRKGEPLVEGRGGTTSALDAARAQAILPNFLETLGFVRLPTVVLAPRIVGHADEIRNPGTPGQGLIYLMLGALEHKNVAISEARKLG